MCNQMVTSEIRELFHARFVQILIICLDKMQVKLFPNFTSIPFGYLLISWVMNYISNLGFLTCLSWIVSIKNSTLSNV